MSSLAMNKNGCAKRAALALCVAIATAWHDPTLAVTPAHIDMELSVDLREGLERRIDKIANEVVNRKPYLEEDPLPIHIKSTFDMSLNMLIMDMDERLGPRSGDGSLEELQSDVQDAIWPLIRDIPGFTGLDWRFGGKEIYFWFPGDRPREQSSQQKRGAPSVLIAAGHGYYYHYGYKDWRPQRAIHNGILEDEITTQYSTVLYSELVIHDVSASWIREGKFASHKPSGQPYHMIAARYQLEEKFPGRPDIWHSLPGNTDNQRERLEDILSRPLFANEIGAGALVHLHTNASDNTSARGTRVFHQAGSVESSRLGSMILCYMNEAIHSLDEYEAFPVASASTPGNHGENRLASMPSVIVEVGFHTNSEDAEALKDIMFMGKSMAGLAKGYRLYATGEQCQPLVLNAPKKVEGYVDQNVLIPISAQGFPDFPLNITASLKQCPGGCWVGRELADSPDEMAAISIPYRCEAPGVWPVVVEGRDLSGAKAKPTDVEVACLPKPEA